MTVRWLLFSSVIGGGLLAYSISAGQMFLTVICCLLLVLSFLAKKDSNNQFFILVFFAVFLINKLIFYPIQMFVFPETSGFIDNCIAFSIQLVFDIILIYMIKNRMRLSILVTGGKEPLVLEKNYIEGPLYGLLIGGVLIDLMALLENFVRNLEHLGINEEFAKQFWEITFFYDYYEYFKYTLASLIIAVLYMGVIIRKRQSLSAA